jgi:Predicted transcriptional regulator containing the HTH domain
MSEQKDTKILEAILFASGEPVLEDDLKQKISFKNNLIQYLENIQDSYKNSGINLVKTGNKWSFRTSEDIKNDLTIFKKQKRKLSRAALETLAIIAYQQPITTFRNREYKRCTNGQGFY